MTAEKRRTDFSVALNEYYGSTYYIAVTGGVITASALFGLEIFAFFYVVLNHVLICLYCDSAKPTTVLLLTVCFCISSTHIPTDNNPSSSSRGFLSQPSTIAVIITLGIISVAAFAYFLVKKKKLKQVIFSDGRLSSGLAFFAAGLVLNGFGFGAFSIKNLSIGLLEAFSFYFVYSYFLACVDDEEGLFEYYCKISVASILIVFLQLVITFFKAGALQGAIDKNDIYLGWGVSNNIGVIFALTLPCAVYLGYSKKRGFIFFALSAICIVGAALTLSRASLIATLISFVLSVGYAVYKTKEKRKLAFYVAATLLLCIAVFSLFMLLLPDGFSSFVNAGMGDSGRFELWRDGFSAFLSSPSFGIGLSHKEGFSDTIVNFFFGLVTYHNTIFQMLFSCGIVGLAGYLVMRAQTVTLFLESPTPQRFFMLFSIVAVLFNSLLDNHLFYFYPAFFYSLSLVLAEKDLNKTIKNKPIVAKK